MFFILPGSLHLRSSPCPDLSIIKIKIIAFEAHHIQVILHTSSLSVRHRGRCLPCTRMTNINISHKYSNASHLSLIIRFLFHTLKRKLIKCKNWSQIHSLNLSPRNLPLKDFKISNFPLSPLPSSLPPATSLAVLF